MMIQNRIKKEDGIDFQFYNKLRIDDNLYYGEFNDEQLAKLFVDTRDDRAFNELVNRYGDRIYRLALRITKNTYSAEDVLQNVFLILVKKLESFKQESKLSTWIYAITSNESLLILRKNISRSAREISTDIHTDDSGNYHSKLHEINAENSLPDNWIISKEIQSILDNAINELPEEYKIVFQLRDIEGLGNRETAEILGLSVPAVKSRILRARNQIRDKLIAFFPENRTDNKRNSS